MRAGAPGGHGRSMNQIRADERLSFVRPRKKQRVVSLAATPQAVDIDVATTALLVVDRGSADRGRPLALTFCLYLAAALLITPMSEVHHLAAVLPGLTLLVRMRWSATTISPRGMPCSLQEYRLG